MNKNTLFEQKNIKKIFFGGIYGASVSGLSIFCKELGYEVEGSDVSDPPEMQDLLESFGINVIPSQTAKNLIGADAYVYTHALSEDNPELTEAKRLGIPVLSRSELLGRIIAAFPKSIGVCGTHGKSTVSAMTAQIFSRFDKGTAAFIGARGAELPPFTNGIGTTAVFEACEYKRAFLDMTPTVAAVLNIEKEHTDTYPLLSDALEAYTEFASRAKTAVLCSDCKSCLKIAPYMQKTYFYSLCDRKSDMYGENITENKGFYSFDAVFRGKKLFRADLKVPGEHNVSNALCAALLAYTEGADAEDIKAGLEGFHGIKRRFEYIGKCGESPVFDDYAHHPSEIKCTVKTAKALGYKRIVCAFQPHTYSRTKAHFDEFAKALSEFDETIIADIYAAREANVFGVTSEMLAQRIKYGIYISDLEKIAEHLKSLSSPDTLIITLGAGRMDTVAKKITK